MAFRLFGNSARRRNPLPRVLGENPEDLAFAAGGLSATAVANDKIVAPLLDYFLPALKSNQMVRKGIDAATTLGTAFLLSVGVDQIDGHAARLVQFGGSMLGIARFGTMLTPHYAISSVTPIDAFAGGLLHFTPQTQVTKVTSVQTVPQLGPGGTFAAYTPQGGGVVQTTTLSAGTAPAYGYKGGL